MFYVYQITGPTGVYIGKATQPNKRWARHWFDANHGSNTYLHRTMKKYGRDKFQHEILLQTKDEAAALECEKLIIAHKRAYCELYNLTEGGDGTSGRKASAETRQRMREAQLGRKHSAETCKKMSENRSPAQKEALRTMNRKRLGQKHTPEWCEAASKRWLGRQHTAEAKQLMSELQTARYAAMTEEQRRARNQDILAAAEARKGKPGTPQTPESIAKMLASRAANKAAKEARL